MRALIAIVLLVVAVTAPAAEYIERFQSDIQILSDGSMEVIETITVNAQGKSIRRGIYRDFPTVYRDRLNNRIQVRFEVMSVRRNGKPESWFEKPLSNGVRVYAGSKDVNIPQGRHTYEFTYRSNRQLGFFEAHDELYWNVTGNGWPFPIHSVVAYVYLPKTVPARAMAVEAYTGVGGAKGQDFEAGIDDEGIAWFRSTRTLDAGEGLTLVTTWPKGHVRAPTGEEKLDWFLEDNGHVLAGMLGLMILLAYYAVAWAMVGRDPAAGGLVPRYKPPEGCSPAAMRYVRKMGYDDKCFTAALVNLAVKGLVRIEDRDGEFSVTATAVDDSAPMAPGEKALRSRLLAGGSLVLKQSNHERVRSVVSAHQLRIEAEYEKNYFISNKGVTLFGGLISLLTLGTAVIWSGEIEDVTGTGFMLVWMTGWSFGTFVIVSRAVSEWRGARGVVGHGAAFFLSLFSLPFVVGWFFGAGALAEFAGPATVALLVCLIAINILFYNLMKAPTLQGRELLDMVEGFREYLQVVDADELQLSNAPQDTPELFERYLPYALALDLEDVWGERFEAVIAAARGDAGYEGPDWYQGPRSFSASSLAGSVGQGLASSLSSSSQAPGSSSGSGGGGSSGGGGGGGGGGGW